MPARSTLSRSYRFAGSLSTGGRTRGTSTQPTEDPDYTLYVRSESFDYEGCTAPDEDMATDQRQRPAFVEGLVWRFDPPGRPELVCLADLEATGFHDRSHDTYSAAGHLIARTLGGTDDPENLAPVSKATNDKMSRVEAELRDLTAERPHWLTVEVFYRDDDRRVPSTFDYKLYAALRRPDPTASPPLVPCFQRTVFQERLVVGSTGYGTTLVAVAGQAQRELRERNWRVESVEDLRGRLGTLPPLDRRPLAFLDYALFGNWALGQQLGITAAQKRGYRTSVGPNKGFTAQWVRDLAIKGSALAGGDQLRSHAYGPGGAMIDQGLTMVDDSEDLSLPGGVVVEQFDSLMVGGGANAPQVDHIHPEAGGGANCFSNAQVVSQWYNGRKSDHTTEFLPRDTAWREEAKRKLTQPGSGVTFHPLLPKRKDRRL